MELVDGLTIRFYLLSHSFYLTSIIKQTMQLTRYRNGMLAKIYISPKRSPVDTNVSRMALSKTKEKQSEQ